ncbi:MAG TPA: isopentenyl-diphosphate Delta-isomerase [Streptosporangiaceae bacterium]|jgi:isopentenyl-diphosphate delta-isomerase|nr:isopentenyl-diphosphate Delta-isomerase [Streptosporangiaceae bacterium]
MTGREHLLVELVDDTGAAVGACSVGEAHTAPGQCHRAFSVLLYDRDGRLLLQQRAAVKTRFASRWSNTCCGHPAPGEDTATAAAQRLTAELGLTQDQITPLTEIGVFHYQAADPASGRVESEWDHVLVATFVGGSPTPDESEVSDCAWVSPASLRASMARDPDHYTPWLSGVLDVATEDVQTGSPG